jgi:ferric-dicitrate binding protein FerR (iron transport regulator)
MTEPLDWKILDRCLAGEATPAEREILARWVGEDPARAAWVRALGEAAGGRAEEAPEGPDTDAAWARLAARMEEPVPVPGLRAVSGGATRGPRGWGVPWMRVAAAVLLLLGGGALLWRVAGRPAAPAAMREAATGAGERKTLRLADGTEVTLGVESRLRYPARFDGPERRVELAGEALFRVAKRPAQPFLVRAGDAETRVLGTQFGVRAYAGTGEPVRVVVAEGRVLLRHAGAPDTAGVVLGRGDVAEVRTRGRPAVRHDARPERLLGWTRGRLVLEDATMPEAAAELERWYGVPVAVDSALSRRRLTAELRGESLQRALDAIALAMDAGVRRRGDTVVFVPRADAPSPP